MSEEGEGKSRGIDTDPQHQHHYGTFQGVPSYPQPAIGFPQPIPPPGAVAPGPPYYHHSHGYQAVPVVEGRPVREARLPCCGIGLGWFLFIIGFFLAAIPWYAGAFILLCSRVDYREKPGYAACTIAAVLAAIAIILGVTKGTHTW
ncbi:large ribosomal subunit protein eL20z [Magnolia sinica]|uniref:large ribosomal subunit protein eL20z n=1 Tax=Magnolia sinica TaxID=86752 RepID=UPI002658018B|nr:large ribosomal subunit protein eL20z [Magnolia sinica]